MVLAVQKRTEERVAMSESPLYINPEKFISSGEPSVKLVLKEVNDYHLWFKCCENILLVTVVEYSIIQSSQNVLATGVLIFT